MQWRLKCLNKGKLYLLCANKDFKEKNDYIFLLKDELNSINFKETKILQKAQKLYEAVKNNPDSRIANRCFDFIELEKFCLLYK